MAPDVPAPSLAAADDPVVRRLADDGLYLGITAWTEPSLVESSELYPPTVTTAEQRLWFYASRTPASPRLAATAAWRQVRALGRSLPSSSVPCACDVAVNPDSKRPKHWFR